MKNSQKVKNILIELAVKGELPSDMNNIDANLFGFCDKLLTVGEFLDTPIADLDDVILSEEHTMEIINSIGTTNQKETK